MKKLLFLFIAAAASLSASAQGLEFSKVIDTVLSVSVNSCTYMYPYYTGSGITVPPGKTWKVEGLGPLNVKGSTSCYQSSCSSSSGNNAYWGVIIDDGQPIKGFLKRRIYNSSVGSYQDESISGITWLSAGTSLQAVIGSTSVTYTNSIGASSTEIFISIIEFTIVP